MGIHPADNSFALKSQVPDESGYGETFFPKYADYIGSGDFGSQFTGKIIKSAKEDGEYGLDGLYQMMFWYVDMAQPYVITYHYHVDYAYAGEALPDNAGSGDDDTFFDWDDFDEAPEFDMEEFNY